MTKKTVEFCRGGVEGSGIAFFCKNVLWFDRTSFIQMGDDLKLLRCYVKSKTSHMIQGQTSDVKS